MHQLFADFKEVRWEVFYNILIEYVITKKLVRLTNMCLNETYNRVRKGNHFLLRVF